ncbi:MAG: TetR/AcrR family transcriptional regulator [Halobacteria archaeon]|nr:TetR/AcrR family transcriptional regulator [Halobacteria archaeon]
MTDGSNDTGKDKTDSSESDASEDTEYEIMLATYKALSKHGYANLTMQDIADEFSKSKSLLHYYYDTKHDLFIAYLDYLHDEFKRETEKFEEGDPVERLGSLIDILLHEPSEYEDFHLSLLELKTQAPHDDEIRDRMVDFELYIRQLITGIIQDGIDEGVFRDVDPNSVAVLMINAMHGARVQEATQDMDVEPVAEAIDDYVVSQVLLDGDQE